MGGAHEGDFRAGGYGHQGTARCTDGADGCGRQGDARCPGGHVKVTGPSPKEKAAQGKWRGKRKFLLIDVRKAHLHAVPAREVYVQLPPAIKAKHPGKCWLLRRCL